MDLSYVYYHAKSGKHTKRHGFWHMSTCFAEPVVSDLYLMCMGALRLFLWLPYPNLRLICPCTSTEFASCVVYHKVFAE